MLFIFAVENHHNLLFKFFDIFNHSSNNNIANANYLVKECNENGIKKQ